MPDFAQTLAGGKSEHVRIFDVEYSWNRLHEDLRRRATPRSPTAPRATRSVRRSGHRPGTAVLGELAADANGSA